MRIGQKRFMAVVVFFVLAVSLVVLITFVLGDSGQSWLPRRHHAQDAARPMQSNPIVAASSQSQLLTQQPPGAPTASADNPAVTLAQLRSFVDAAMSEKAAVFAAQQPMTAADGTTQSVCFVYCTRQEKSPSPTLTELTARCASALVQQQEASRLLKEATESNDLDAARKAAAAQIAASRALAGEDLFLTVEMSLSTNYPPLLMFRKGLPAWLAFQEAARRSASRSLGSEVMLLSVMQASPVAAPILIFSDAAGRVAYVDIKSMRVHTTAPQMERRSPRTNTQGAAERAVRVSAQWRSLFSNGLDLTQFSLEGLTDMSKQR